MIKQSVHFQYGTRLVWDASDLTLDIISDAADDGVGDTLPLRDLSVDDLAEARDLFAAMAKRIDDHHTAKLLDRADAVRAQVAAQAGGTLTVAHLDEAPPS